jgi:anti-anti-sigma factor
MAMRERRVLSGGEVLLLLEGRLDVLPADVIAAVRRAIEDDAVRLVTIDLAEVRSISTEAVAFLLGLRDRCRTAGKDLRIAGPQDAVRSKLVTLGVLPILTGRSDEADPPEQDQTGA